MELTARASMLVAIACWLGAASADLRGGRALEWQLLGVPFAATALLVWTERYGHAGFDRWWPWLWAAGLYPLRGLAAPTGLDRRVQTAAALAALGIGLMCSAVFAHEMPATRPVYAVA